MPLLRKYPYGTSWRFRSVFEEDLDKVLETTSKFILKQLGYSLSVSMRDRNLQLII